MSDTKFTPGEWCVDEPNGKNNGFQICAENGRPSAWIGLNTWEPQQRANARLIAAAPRLYHALEKVLEEFDIEEFEDYKGDNYAWLADEIEAALAAARGEHE